MDVDAQEIHSKIIESAFEQSSNILDQYVSVTNMAEQIFQNINIETRKINERIETLSNKFTQLKQGLSNNQDLYQKHGI